MSETIDIFVDGESVKFEVEEFGMLDKMIWGAKAPDELRHGDGEAVGPEVIQFLIDITLEQTVLTRELLDEVPQEELGRLFNGIIQASFGGEVDLDERMEDGTHIPDSLFKDPEDFR